VLITCTLRATSLARPLLRLVVLGNVLWVGASVVLLVAGLVEPNGLGVAAVLGQAVGVAALTALESTGFRCRSAEPQ
jgi:hypothetical protein